MLDKFHLVKYTPWGVSKKNYRKIFFSLEDDGCKNHQKRDNKQLRKFIIVKFLTTIYIYSSLYHISTLQIGSELLTLLDTCRLLKFY